VRCLGVSSGPIVVFAVVGPSTVRDGSARIPEDVSQTTVIPDRSIMLPTSNTRVPIWWIPAAFLLARKEMDSGDRYRFVGVIAFPAETGDFKCRMAIVEGQLRKLHLTEIDASGLLEAVEMNTYSERPRYTSGYAAHNLTASLQPLQVFSGEGMLNLQRSCPLPVGLSKGPTAPLGLERVLTDDG